MCKRKQGNKDAKNGILFSSAVREYHRING